MQAIQFNGESCSYATEGVGAVWKKKQSWTTNDLDDVFCYLRAQISPWVCFPQGPISPMGGSVSVLAHGSSINGNLWHLSQAWLGDQACC